MDENGKLYVFFLIIIQCIFLEKKETHSFKSNNQVQSLLFYCFLVEVLVKSLVEVQWEIWWTVKMLHTPQYKYMKVTALHFIIQYYLNCTFVTWQLYRNLCVDLDS